MAVNISVFDLLNFPNNSKTVTVDMSELVPLGNSGEDVWVLSATTTATASGGAAIQKLYINDTRLGWAKSSGLKSGPYTISASQKNLKVAIDEAIGNAVTVALDVSALPLTGEAVAADLQNKINATASPGGPKAGNLSYLNAVVHHDGATFQIVSGSTSKTYTGSDRSSVAVADGATNGVAAELGFDIPFTSEALASNPTAQTELATSYTAGGTALVLDSSTLVATGDCIAVTDGTNTEFRGVTTADGANITLASGMANNYSSGALVQVLALREPGAAPTHAYRTIDDYVKYSISSIVNQIDFSS